MRFFFDNCLSPRLAQALNILDEKHKVTHLRKKFREDVDDPEWIRVLSDEGNWVVVSSDARILRNPQNREAWRQSRLTGFFFKKGWANFRMWEQTWRAVRWWPEITKQAERVQPGVGFWVPANFGKFKMVERA